MKLAESYGGRPQEELPMLFQRILQNAIRDYFRRKKVRSQWMTLLSSLTPGRNDEEDQDPLDSMLVERGTQADDAPPDTLQRTQVIEIINEEITKLPPRQREAFVMRYWEELDVGETARAMGCSEGSVKTHCSRATRTLATALKSRGITL